MRLAICDDNPHDLKQLSELLRTYDPGTCVDTFSAAAALYESTRQKVYDAVILDIEMEAPNGYEIAPRLAREAAHPVLLFLTNSPAPGAPESVDPEANPGDAFEKALDFLRSERENAESGAQGRKRTRSFCF